MNSNEQVRSINSLKRVINLFETQIKLANRLKISSEAITNWKSGRRNIPPLRAIEMAQLTKNKIKASDLRPDLPFLKSI